jgi:hypothetical protein
VLREEPVSTAIWAYQKLIRDSLFQRVLESAHYANVRPWHKGHAILVFTTG